MGGRLVCYLHWFSRKNGTGLGDQRSQGRKDGHSMAEWAGSKVDYTYLPVKEITALMFCELLFLMLSSFLYIQKLYWNDNS